MEENSGFSYTYAAPTEEERREIEAIRRQYEPMGDKQDKLARVRRLDARVRRIPDVVFAVFLVVGILAFGGGMALCLNGGITAGALAGGCVLCAFGAAVCAASHYVKKKVKNFLKDKYGDAILALTEELLGDAEK